jgi:tetratricopeptide (TPR) repeat protein
MVKRALIAAVENYDYPDFFPILKTPSKDAEAMKKILIDPNHGGFEEDNVSILIDPDSKRLERAIGDLCRQSKEEDIMFIYLSCHGSKDKEEELYLATKESCCDENGELIDDTAVDCEFINKKFAKSDCKRIFVMVDACYSGGFTKKLRGRKSAINLNEEQEQIGKGIIDKITKGIEQTKAAQTHQDLVKKKTKELQAKGIAVLTSSTIAQPSHELEKEGLSLFTHCFIEGIKTGDIKTNEELDLTVGTIYDYLKAKVPEKAHEFGYKMNPEYEAHGDAHNIGLFKAKVKDPQESYRSLFENFFLRDNGNINISNTAKLYKAQQNLDLTDEQVKQIQNKVKQKFEEKKAALKKYEDTVYDTVDNSESINNDTIHIWIKLKEDSNLEDNDVIPIYIKVAKKLQKNSKSEQAIALLENVVELHPKSKDIYVGLGDIYLELGKLEEALDAFNKAQNLGGHGDINLVHLANHLKQQGKYQQAITTYENIIEQNPDTEAEVYIGLADALNQEEKYTLALETINKILGDKDDEIPKNDKLLKQLDKGKIAEAYTQKGIAFKERNKLNKAKDFFRLAIKKDPNSAVAKFFLAEIIKDQDRNKAREYIEEAKENFTEAIRSNSSNVEAHLYLGNTLLLLENLRELNLERLLEDFEQLDFDKLKENLQQLNLEKLSLEETKEKLAQLDLPTQIKNIKLAEAHFREAERINPECAQTIKFIAVALENQGLYQEGIKEAKKAQQKNANLATVSSILGNCLIQQDQHEEARDEFIKATNLNPELANAQFGFGHVLLRFAQGFLTQKNSKQKSLKSKALGKFNEAIRRLNEAIEKHQLASYFGLLGYLLYQKGTIQDNEDIKSQGIEKCREATEEINPDDSNCHYLYALVLSENKDLDKAISHIEIAIEQSPNTAYFYENLGNFYYQKEEHEKAEIEYKKALVINPTNPSLHNSFASVLHNQGKLKKAIEHYEIALEQYQYNPWLYVNLAHALYNQSYEEKNEIDKFKNEIEKENLSEEAKRNCEENIDLKTREREDLLKQAKKNCERAIHLDNKEAISFNLLGDVLYTQDEFAQAAEKFGKAIELNPNEIEYYKNYIYALIQIKDNSRLTTALKSTLNQISNNNEIDAKNKAEFGIFAFKQIKDEDYGQFLPEFEIIANQVGDSNEIKDEDKAEFYYQWAYTLENEKQFEEAIANYRLATECNPNHANAHFKLGLNLFEHESPYDPEEVKNVYIKAIENGYNNPEIVYCNLGTLFDREEEYKNAIIAYKEAIKLDPNEAAFYRFLRDLLWRLDKYDEVITLCKKEIEQFPNEVDGYFYLGKTYIKQKEYDDAARSLLKVKELLTSQDKVDNSKLKETESLLRSLAKYYYEESNKLAGRGEHSIAIDGYNNAIVLYPEYAEAYRQRGNSLNELERYSEAIDSISQALEFNPSDAEAYYLRGYIYLDRQPVKDYQKAADDFDKAIDIDDLPMYRNKLAKASFQLGLVEYESEKTENFIEKYQESKEIVKPIADLGDKEAEKFVAELDLAFNIVSYAQGSRFQDLIQSSQKIVNKYNGLYDLNVLEQQLGWGDRLLEDAKILFAEITPPKPPEPPKLTPEEYYKGGIEYIKQGQYREAIQCFENAINLQNDYVTAYTDMGNAYYEIEEVREAMKSWETSIRIILEQRENGIGGYDTLLAENLLAIAVAKCVYFDADYQELNKCVEQALSLDERLNNLDFLKEQRLWGDRLLADAQKLIRRLNDNGGNSSNDNIAEEALRLAENLRRQGLTEYEIGNQRNAVENWQKSAEISQKLAEAGMRNAHFIAIEMQLAISIVLFANGNQDEKILEAVLDAFKRDNDLFNTDYLKKRGWGSNLIEEVQKLLMLLRLYT